MWETGNRYMHNSRHTKLACRQGFKLSNRGTGNLGGNLALQGTCIYPELPGHPGLLLPAVVNGPAIWDCGKYNLMVRQVPIWHMTMSSLQNFIEMWSAISRLRLVHCCRTTEKWPTWRIYMLFNLSPTKFEVNIEWWLAINNVAWGFLNFPSCNKMSKPQAAGRFAALPKDDLPHLYLHQPFSMIIQPTPTKFGVNIVR